MEKIKYIFSDGTIKEIEVSDEFKERYETIKKSEALSNRRHNRRNQSLERSLDNGWDIEDPSADFDLRLEVEEQNEELYEAIFKLKPDEQFIIQQVFFERVTKVELAKRLRVSRRAIHKRLVTILGKLKKFLE